MPSDADPSVSGEVAWAEDATGPLLRFSGVIDRESVRRFRVLVPPASWPARVDLSGVTALEAPGVELLLHLARKPRRHGGELQLLGVPEGVRPVLVRAGLSRLLPRANGTPTSA